MTGNIFNNVVILLQCNIHVLLCYYCLIILGDKLEGYQKKKYVCKLLFMFLLGNDINFGYQEAVNLLSSIKFTEKQIVRLFPLIKTMPHPFHLNGSVYASISYM